MDERPPPRDASMHGSDAVHLAICRVASPSPNGSERVDKRSPMLSSSRNSLQAPNPFPGGRYHGGSGAGTCVPKVPRTVVGRDAAVAVTDSPRSYGDDSTAVGRSTYA